MRLGRRRFLQALELPHVRRQRRPERLAVAGHGGIFATFALLQHGLVILRGQRRLDRHPAAVQRARHRAAGRGLATQAADRLLQLFGGRRTFACMALEDALQLR